MKIVQFQVGQSDISTSSVVTIGNFDGVHCGHLKVLAEVRQRALALQSESVAVTFNPHPSQFLRAGNPLQLITPLDEKLRLLEKGGMDRVLVVPFADVREWPAEDFARKILAEALHAQEVHEGETFRFGHNAEAGLPELTRMGASLGFTVHACAPLMLRGAAVSSSRIRSLLADGRLAEARALLGRPFAIPSTPAPGRGYGTRYTVPTINLAPCPDLLPAHGVYVTTLRVGADDSSRLFHGVTNIGNRPTFGADSFAVETHLLDFEPLPLSESTPLELTFLRRLRAEQHFPSPEALRTQIGVDVRQTQRYFALKARLVEE